MFDFRNFQEFRIDGILTCLLTSMPSHVRDNDSRFSSVDLDEFEEDALVFPAAQN